VLDQNTFSHDFDMRRITSSILASAILLLGGTSVKADYDAFGIDYSGDASIGNRVYGVDTESGTKTLLTTKVFDSNSWSAGTSYVSSTTGEIMIRGGGTRYHGYNWKSNTWRDVEIDNSGMTMFEKPTSFGIGSSTVQIGSDANDIDVVEDGLNIDGAAVITKQSDGSVQIGADGNDIDVVEDGLNIDGAAVITKQSDGSIQIGTDENDIDITSEGLAIDGEPLITKKANGELHIGKNSWITKEENGVQKVYAKDAAGNPIPIDYTNGTKLLINGRDVDQAIDNVGALSAALTGLPTVPQDSPLACGVGAGAHSGSNALSGGCASKINERLTFNAAASFIPANQEYQGTDNSWSGRAGFVFKLGKITKPTLISMKEKKVLQSKVEDLAKSNKNIKNENQELKELLALQNQRLEKLEQIALGHFNSKELVSSLQ